MSSTAISPSIPRPAGQSLIGAIPVAMFSMTTRSSMVTSPSFPQSPKHATGVVLGVGEGGIAVVDAEGLGVGELAGVTLAVGIAVGLFVGTADGVTLGLGGAGEAVSDPVGLLV
jgi:hypothetical protein